jgi:RWD domain
MQAMDYAQEQHDELIALSSIWQGEFRQKAGVWAKQEYAFDISPGYDEHDNFARITLVFSYPARYPQLPPVLRLEDAQHLSDAEVKELKALLTSQAQSLAGRGNVFILDLLMEAQQFVRDHNRRPDRSLYDNMESEDRRQKQENEEKLDAEEARMKEEDKHAAQQQAARERTKREQQLQKRRSSIEDAGAGDEHGAAAAAAEDALHANSSSEFDSNDSTDNEVRRDGAIDGNAGARSSWYRSQFKEVCALNFF